MNKINIKDNWVRYSLWRAYGCKCFYSKEPICFDELEIDHVIPRKNEGLYDAFLSYNEKNHLVENFSLDSFCNLVPTKRTANNTKSNMEFDLSSVIYYFEITKKYQDKFIEYFNKKPDKRVDEALNIIKTKYNQNQEKFDLERIMDFFSDCKTEFEPREELFGNDGQKYIRKYTNRIGLIGKLPSFNDVEIECEIHFRTMKVRDCILHLDNKVILGELFSNLFTDPSAQVRKFIIENADIYDDNVKLVIGSNHLLISRNDLDELCDVIDVYGRQFINEIKSIESILETKRFNLSRRKNHYIIGQIENNLWKLMIEYAIEHDIDNGKNGWYMFDRNNYYLKLYTRQHSDFLDGYHSDFDTEYEEDYRYYPDLCTRQRTLTWGFVGDYDRKGMTTINEIEKWSGEYASDWFFSKFMKEVVSSKGYKKYSKKGAFTLGELISGDKELFIEYFEDFKCNSAKDLTHIIHKYQRYFHSYPHRNYFIPVEQVKGLYDVICTLISLRKRVDIGYLSSKLRVASGSKEDVILNIQNFMRNISETKYSGFDLDFIFRAMFASVENIKPHQYLDVIEYVEERLAYFAKLCDQEILLDKYAIDFI